MLGKLRVDGGEVNKPEELPLTSWWVSPGIFLSFIFPGCKIKLGTSYFNFCGEFVKVKLCKHVQML